MKSYSPQERGHSSRGRAVDAERCRILGAVVGSRTLDLRCKSDLSTTAPSMFKSHSPHATLLSGEASVGEQANTRPGSVDQ